MCGKAPVEFVFADGGAVEERLISEVDVERDHCYLKIVDYMLRQIRGTVGDNSDRHDANLAHSRCTGQPPAKGKTVEQLPFGIPPHVAATRRIDQ